MALFKSSKSNTTASQKSVKDSISTATIITKGTAIKGDIVSNDTIHVDGDVEGSIKVDNIVVIGRSGMVQGDIQANKIVTSGNINGAINCKELEVMESSSVNSQIQAERINVSGKIDGEILCNTIMIEQGGKVEHMLQAKNVTVSGTLIGEVACELLSTKKTGFVKGSMFVSNISNEGGTVEGSIGQYKDLVIETKEEDLESEEKIDTKTKKS
jgi:cytoskeletal protein CcmA (bactofilin family)